MQRFAVGLFIAVIASLIVFVITDYAMGTTAKPEPVTVADRIYIPEEVTYTTERRADGSTYTERHVEPEKWRVIVSMRDDAVNIDTKRSIWNKAAPNSTVWITYRKGGLSNSNYNYQIVQTQGGGSTAGAGAGGSF